MKPKEMRRVIDQYFIDGDDSYECSVETGGFYNGDKSALLCSISSCHISIEPPDTISIEFYTHPIEDLEHCPVISREALKCSGEFFLCLDIRDAIAAEDVYSAAMETVDMWLKGIDERDAGGRYVNFYGQYIKPGEKALNFLYALVGYHYWVMKQKADKA